MPQFENLSWVMLVFYKFEEKGNVNVIVKAFGSTNFLCEVTKPIQKMNYFNPPTLKFHATAYLRSSMFPTTVLHVAIADVKHYFNKKKWLGKCHVAIEREIPECEDIFCLPLETLEELGACASKDVGHYQAETMEMFSFPEYSSTREQIEARKLDYAHILNNLQMQCTQHGLSYYFKEAFQAICKQRPDILSHS